MTTKSLLLTCALLSLTACGSNFEMPSVMSDRRAELATATHNQSYSAAQMSDGFLQQMAQYYARYGAGPVAVTTTYDPKASSDAALEANRLAARVGNTLKANGVPEVMTDTLPTPGAGKDMRVLMKFGTITARAPRDCGQMPAYGGTGATTNDEAYKYGCTLETLMAQQVMRPADLAGRAPTTPSDGARQTAVINDRGYYDKKAFPPLTGEMASE